MNSYKTTAGIVGALFLMVMITWFIGFIIIHPIISAPDYLSHVYPNKIKVTLGVLFEIIETAGVIGIVVMMFPLLKNYNENIAHGYFGLRIIECVMLIVGAICSLLLITLSQEYIEAGVADTSTFQIAGTLLIALRNDWSFYVLTVFYSLAALMFYYVLFQTKLIPRFISIWGLIAAALVLINEGVVRFSDFDPGVFSAGIAMGLNELFLGAWLIVKGFNPSAVAHLFQKQI